MAGRPEHDHAFEQGSAGTRDVGEEVHIGARDEAGSLVVECNAVFHGRVLEEAHFAADVVDRRDKEV